MKVGIWQGSTPERVHAAGDDDRPLCHAANRNYMHDSRGPATASFWRTWSGSLAEVDCRRCLAMLRRQAVIRLEAVDDRLAGKGGIQVDMEERL